VGSIFGMTPVDQSNIISIYMKKNIDIQSCLSTVQKNTLQSSIKQQLWYIHVKRHHLSPISITSFKLKEAIVAGEEISLLLGSSKVTHKICFSSSTQSTDDYGEHEKIRIDQFDISESNHTYFKEHSSIPVQFPFGNMITQIEVYGISVEAIERRDDDFPEEVEVLNIDVDTLFKVNLKDGSFFAIHAKGGFVLLQLYSDEEYFNQYISMTQASWGAEYGYRHKYTLKVDI
jgi:hypothetical protein